MGRKVVTEMKKETKYVVGCRLLMEGPVTGEWKPTVREALKSFADRFIRFDKKESDILSLRIWDNQKPEYNQDILTQPYMRVALIEYGVMLADPREPPKVEFISARKRSDTLEADGWVYAGPDPMYPGTYIRYSREKKA